MVDISRIFTAVEPGDGCKGAQATTPITSIMPKADRLTILNLFILFLDFGSKILWQRLPSLKGTWLLS
jgi:hypothetical protein